MWKAERFEDTHSQTALDQMLEFINRHALTPDDFKCVVVEGEQDWVQRYVLLYRERERVASR